MYRLSRLMGKVTGAIRADGVTFDMSHPMWLDFLDWNAKQETPLDLSDKPPEADPTAQSRAEALAVIRLFKAKPKAERTAADRAAALDAVLELMG